MKSKKIPRSVRLTLLLLGCFGGSLATMILFAVSMVIPLAIWVMVAYFSVVLGLFYIITWKYRKTLEEWDILEPKKEKKKK